MTTDWQSDLRARGYRLTPQRQLVLEAVDKLEHSTPDDILAEVRRTAGGVNISTVYRTLELLEELGLVSHAHLGHGAPTYHLADRHDHMHLVCRDCTEVIEADLSVAGPFAEQLLASFGFDTDMKHFAIFGRCGKCAAQGGVRAEPDGADTATDSAATAKTTADAVRDEGGAGGAERAGKAAGPPRQTTGRAREDGREQRSSRGARRPS